MTTTHNTSLARAFQLPCGTVLPNRLAKAAMSEQMARVDGSPSEEMIRLYDVWGRGGAGLVVTGNVMVDRRGFVEPRNAALEDARHLGSMSRWSAASKAGGGVALMQLNHPGRLASAPLTRRPVAPSAIRPPVPVYNLRKPRALDAAGITDIRERFARAASLAVAAGFDGVQVHAAHGYLLSQFLTPSANLRTDAYGGQLHSRSRLLLEIVAAIRDAVGPTAPVSVKLNSADFHRGGMTEDESLHVALTLAEAGVDLLEVSGGSYESPTMIGEGRPSTVDREAYFLRYAQRVREHTMMPLMLTGGFRTRQVMEQVIGDGAVDVIGLARPLAIIPDLPNRLLAGQDTPDLPLPPRLEGRRATTANAYLQLAWHGAYFRSIAAGDAAPVGISFRRALSKAVLRTSYLAVTQS